MKKILNYPDQINVLASAGTREALVAIAFHRGDLGRYADPARDFIAQGIARYLSGLSEKERARYAEILETVRTSETLRRQVKSG